MDHSVSGDHGTQAAGDAPVKRGARYFTSAVFDRFLDPADANELLAFAFANADSFKPSTVVREDGLEVDREVRRSFDFHGSLKAWSRPLEARLRERAGDLMRATALEPFPLDSIEMTLSAYRDGCFYTAHIDTVTGVERPRDTASRVLTAVYYVNREPARYSGGVLELLPLVGKGEPQPLPPAHNRLVTFPAFALHRVTHAEVPGDRFEDARFSVNCWLCRARG